MTYYNIIILLSFCKQNDQNDDVVVIKEIIKWQCPMRVALVKGTNQTSHDTS